MGAFNKFHLALLVLVMAAQDGTEAARILGLFPIASRSHFAMSETLMRALAARGHMVDVVSPFPLKSPIANYRDISIADSVPTSVNNLTLESAETLTITNLKMFIESRRTMICDLLELPQLQGIIKNPPTDPPYDLIVHELSASECFLVFGRHLKVPMVGTVTSRLFDWSYQPLGNPPSYAFVPSSFTSFGQRMTFLERLQNTLNGAYIRAVYWKDVQVQKDHVKKHFGLELSSMSELHEHVGLVLVNSHPSFDYVRPMTPGVVEVGGLHVTDGVQNLSPEVQKWLDESKDGCVYFSFGSMVKIESFPTDDIEAFYETFRRIAPVRVLMKVAEADLLPAGLPKNVMTSSWFPQTRVLKHRNVKAFVTHSGLMSMHEAITYGVPMVGFPIFSDQNLNSHLGEHHNVMVTVDYRKITADSFTNAINSVLKNSTYSESSKRLAKLFADRPMSAIDTATYWVEYVIRNGNVLRSEATQLEWWQLDLLDVYAFLIVAASLALYVVKRLMGLILSLLCSRSAQQRKPCTIAASISKKKK